MAIRYSGQVKVRIAYHDAKCGYVANVSWPGGRERVEVGEPKVRNRAVDSPESYDAAAHAAISFADGASDHAEWTDGPFGTGYRITRKPGVQS